MALVGKGDSTVRNALRDHSTLDGLEAAGRITTRKDPSDKRSILLSMAAAEMASEVVPEMPVT